MQTETVKNKLKYQYNTLQYFVFVNIYKFMLMFI